MPATRQGHLLKRHRFDTEGARKGRERKRLALLTLESSSRSIDRSFRLPLLAENFFSRISFGDDSRSVASRRYTYIRLNESEEGRNRARRRCMDDCFSRNRVTRPRDRKPSLTVSCSSKLNNVSWMGCYELVDLVPFSLVYIEVEKFRVVSFTFPSLSRLDHPLTFIQDEGKEKKGGGGGGEGNEGKIDWSSRKYRFEISKLKRERPGPSNNTREGQVIHRLTRWLLRKGEGGSGEPTVR